MHARPPLFGLLAFTAATLSLASPTASAQETRQAGELRFSVSYPASVFAGPFTGRIVVYLSTKPDEPRTGPDWFDPEPMYAIDVRDLAADTPIVVGGAGTISFFPGPPSSLKPG